METDEVHTDHATSSIPDTDVNMQDAKTDAPEAENGVPETGDKPSQTETEKKVSLQCLSFLGLWLPSFHETNLGKIFSALVHSVSDFYWDLKPLGHVWQEGTM